MIKDIANKIAGFVKCDVGGCCMFYAEWLTKVLLKHKINNFKIVEGWVKVENESFWRQHTWIEFEGEKIDPTLAQFEHLGHTSYTARTKKKYTPEEYMEISKKHPSPPEARYLKRPSLNKVHYDSKTHASI